jgi:hypothetical protein
MFKLRTMSWTGDVRSTGKMTNAYNILVGKHKGKAPLRRHRRRWEYNIKMDLRDTAWRVWIGYIWLRIGTVGGVL